jgi:hypothetical protein
MDGKDNIPHQQIQNQAFLIWRRKMKAGMTSSQLRETEVLYRLTKEVTEGLCSFSHDVFEGYL